jgi:hypothetical protein
MAAENALKRALLNSGTGKRFSSMELVRPDPGMAAMISKLIPSDQPTNFNDKGKMEPTAPDVGSFRQVSSRVAESISDAETVMQILPDTELSAQVLISSILSPKDLITTELTYTAPEGLMAPEVATALISQIRQHFEQVYKIKDKLHAILKEALFKTGSYAVAVIPENSIDEVINSPRRISVEALRDHIRDDGSVRNLGILGPAIDRPRKERKVPGLSMEAFEHYDANTENTGRVTFEGILKEPVDDSYLTVVDNFSVLKLPQINQKIREERIADYLKLPTVTRNLARSGQMSEQVALESYATYIRRDLNKLNDRELQGVLYKHHQYTYQPIASLKTQEQLARRSVGNPLIVHLPSEAVIPVHVPGAPDQQVGFFVLIDADGNPVTRDGGIDHYSELSNRMNMNGSFPSAMMSKVKAESQGYNTMGLHEKMDYSVKAYSEMVESDLLARLRNGIYGNGVAIARREEVYRIMLARALAKQHTQILFVPIELMTYFAFQYNDNGTGKSLLDNLKIINSMRSMLTFANTMAGLRNSIGRTGVKLKLDEDDPDPRKTVESAIHEIIRTRAQYFPLGVNSPTDLTDYLQRAAYEIEYEGHPGLPQVGITFEQKQDQYVKPDTELEENLKKRSIMALGLSPDSIDATFQAEFATSLVANNILLAKRVMQYQDQFCPQLSDHCRKVAMNSEGLMQTLRQILFDKFDLLDPDQQDVQAGTAQAQAAVATKVQDKSNQDFKDAVTTAVKQKNAEDGQPYPTPEKPAETNIGTPDETAFVEPKRAAGKGIPLGDTGFGVAPEAPVHKVTAAQKEQIDDHRKLFIVEETLIQFIRGFEVQLPRPNSISLDNQMAALKVYSDALDVGLEAWISEKFFTQDQAGEVAGQTEAIVASIKSYFMRKWMSENGVLPELADLTTADEKGDPVLNLYDMQTTHLESLMKSLTKMMVKLTPVRNTANKVLEDTAAAAGGGGGGGDYGGGDEGGGDEGGGDEGGGGDVPDFDVGGSVGGEENPATGEGAETPAGGESTDAGETSNEEEEGGGDDNA